MDIRDATPDDAEPIARVDVASWRAAYRGLMPDAYLDDLSVEERTADWRRRLLGRDAERGRRTLVADDGAVTGFVRLGPDPDDPAAGFVFLLYVLPAHWGSGAAAALMQASDNALRDMGFTGASLGVLTSNGRARRFYERLGWHLAGPARSDRYGGLELPALRYSRSL